MCIRKFNRNFHKRNSKREHKREHTFDNADVRQAPESSIYQASRALAFLGVYLGGRQGFDSPRLHHSIREWFMKIKRADGNINGNTPIMPRQHLRRFVCVVGSAFLLGIFWQRQPSLQKIFRASKPVWLMGRGAIFQTPSPLRCSIQDA